MQKISYKKHQYFPNNQSSFLYELGRIPSFLFSAAIVAYQWTLSPDHGIPSMYTVGQCKFRPTCSEYTRIMINKHGVVGGLKAGIEQIKKCH